MTWLDDIQNLIKKDLEKATEAVLIKHKVERNSDLVKSLEWDYRNDVWTLVALDYYEYVSTGRRKGILPPPDAILSWIREKGITGGGMTRNQLAWAISISIKKNGIKAKNYIDPVVDTSTDIIAEEIAEQLSEIITDEIVQALEN